MKQKRAQGKINEQNMSRFIIQSNKNLVYNELLGGCFKFWTDFHFSEAIILEFKRGGKKTLEIRVRRQGGNERNAYVRAVNVQGEGDLDIIERYIEQFKGKSGKELLNFEFRREDIN